MEEEAARSGCRGCRRWSLRLGEEGGRSLVGLEGRLRSRRIAGEEEVLGSIVVAEGVLVGSRRCIAAEVVDRLRIAEEEVEYSTAVVEDIAEAVVAHWTIRRHHHRYSLLLGILTWCSLSS